MTKKPLLIRDTIHGDMFFDFPLEMIINHSLFQRLKFIIQNGICYQVFPSMTHTRFQHSLGVCHLSLKWFDLLVQKKLALNSLNEINLETKKISDGYSIELSKTQSCYEKISEKSKEWRVLTAIAALCHDLGHGPFSHLLEETSYINPESFEATYTDMYREERSPSIEAYLNERYKGKAKKVDHEDITLIYLAKIFKDLESENSTFSNDNFLKVCALISKDFKYFLASDKNKIELKDHSDLDLIELLSSLTSGFIDVDRLDYIARDSKMAGVSIGNIEIQKITSSLIPCLYKFNNLGKEEYKNGFLSKFKHHHIIDNFFFSLYQVYTQILYHPRAVQLNHELSLVFKKYKEFKSNDKEKLNDIEWHMRSNDILFVDELRNSIFDENDVKIIDKILNRDKSYKTKEKSILSFPNETTISENVGKNYTRIESHNRPMLKDGSFIWLYNNIDENELRFHSWKKHSLIASKLKDHLFEPNFYWKNEELISDLKKLKTKKSNEVPKDQNSQKLHKKGS